MKEEIVYEPRLIYELMHPPRIVSTSDGGKFIAWQEKAKLQRLDAGIAGIDKKRTR